MARRAWVAGVVGQKDFREGRPALFVVWSQGRNQYVQNGDFQFGGDVRDLFGVAPQNVFMVELSYWMSR